MFTINVSKKMKEERNETHIQVYRGLLGKDRRKSVKKQRYRQSEHTMTQIQKKVWRWTKEQREIQTEQKKWAHPV